MVNSPVPTLEARVEAALDRIRPAIQADGGEVWLMIGACGGCSAANTTLKMGIERVVREDVPEIRAVEQI